MTRGFELERFHAGDEVLFRELVTTHSPRVLAYLRRYASTDADAHDLLQDVWLRVFEKRRTFDGRGSLIGWLLMVSRTVGITAIRKGMHQPPTDPLTEIAAPVDPEGGLLRETLRDAVLALPERQRETIILRLVEGMSTAETAHRLGCAEGTVKASLHQATRKLRELLKESLR